MQKYGRRRDWCGHAMVGAGSVVTRDIPAHGLVYGNPAKLVGYVCSCGRKLEQLIENNESERVYGCVCGNKVKIKTERL